jgi:hypothetical protein
VSGLMSGFVNWYAEHLQRKMEKKVDKIRQIQNETGRLQEQVLEIHVYSMDVRQKDRVPQQVWVRRYQFLKNGSYRIIPLNSGRADCRIYTDTPTLIGVAYGYQEVAKPDGTVISRKKYTAYDALRLGHLTYDGEATALRNIALLQNKLLPEIARELKLVPDSTA